MGSSEVAGDFEVHKLFDKGDSGSSQILCRI